MTQQNLFDNDPSRKTPSLPHNSTPTSKLTACAMRSHATAQQQRVLECLQAAGNAGLTDEQIQASLNLSGNSERPRRAKLVELGLVRNTGLMRKTSSGHAAVVWAVVPPNERAPVKPDHNWLGNDKTNPNKCPATAPTEWVLDFAI